MKNVILFWGTGPKTKVQKGIFSNWYPCRFSVDGREYSSAEQYMMAGKAKLFGDTETLGKILATDKPAEIKRLGRLVKGFDKAKWNKAKFQIVVDGNYAKFSQNKAFKDFLLSTGDAVLAEASPKDKIWGIGLREEDEDASDPSKWKGKNLLGKALMEVRRKLSSGRLVNEDYVIKPDRTIWSRAGDYRLDGNTVIDGEKGLVAPIFLSNSPSRTRWYVLDKGQAKAEYVSIVKLDKNIKLVDITDPKDLEKIGLPARLADEFNIYEPYFSFSSYALVQAESPNLKKKFKGMVSYPMAQALIVVSGILNGFQKKPPASKRQLSWLCKEGRKPGVMQQILAEYRDKVMALGEREAIEMFSASCRYKNCQEYTNKFMSKFEQNKGFVDAYIEAFQHLLEDETLKSDDQENTMATHIDMVQYMLHQRMKQNGYAGYFSHEHARPSDDKDDIHLTIALFDTHAVEQAWTFDAQEFNRAVEHFMPTNFNMLDRDTQYDFEWHMNKKERQETLEKTRRMAPEYAKLTPDERYMKLIEFLKQHS